MRSKSFVRSVAVAASTLVLLSVAQPAFALSSAPDQTWGTNGKTFALARWGNTMFVGGSFKKAVSPTGQKQTVANVAAFDITTGAYISSFAATVANTVATGKPEVDALAVSADGSKLYIGGSFDTVDGQPRQNFAAVDTATGTQLDPNVTASPNQRVQAIVAGPNLVYFGGSFTKVDGYDRQHLAAISASTGALSTTWKPSATAGTDPCPSQLPAGTYCGPVSNGGTGNIHSLALAPDGASLFVGGNFYYINGTPRNALARVSAVDGSLVNWRVKWATIPSEGPNDPYKGPNVVWTILPTTTAVYIGYGRTPNGIEKYTMSTSASSGECASGGCATSLWTRGTPGNPESLALSPDGTRLFVGGHFGTAVLDYRITSCGTNVWAHGLISLNPSNGAIYCDWFPQIVPFGGQSAPGSGVNPPNYIGAFAMQITSNALFVAGYFTSISGVTQSGLARFTLVGSPPPPPPPPTITSFDPASGPVGTSVTVTGTGLTGATRVSFGATVASSFTVDSDTQITVIVPPGAGTSPIKVTTSGGTVKSSTNFQVTSPPPPGGPSITSFDPASGSVGSSVTITGTGFTGATSVSFGATPSASFTVDSDTQITAVVPVGANTAPIKVTTPNGTASSATNFKVLIVVSSFTPAEGPVGTSVTITGSGFTGASSVSFGSTPATSFTVDSDTQVTAVVPSGAVTAPIKVAVPGNGVGKSATNFKVTVLAINNVTPSSGSVGDQVVIAGSGFTGATQVRFNGVDATFSVDSDAQITAVVPAGATSGFITVTTPNGTAQSGSTFTVT